MDQDNFYFVTFVFNPKLDARVQMLNEELCSVGLAGSFNGWKNNEIFLDKDADGVYRVQMELRADIYYYKFILNGHWWVEDLSAAFKLRASDGLGTYNSGIKVGGPSPFVPNWAHGIVWYQIFPERFRRGQTNNDPRGNDLGNGPIHSWQLKEWGSDWYQVDPWEKELGGFFKSVYKRRYGGDLQGIIDKLDYLQELGVDAIYLNPIFRAPSLHKYDGECFHHVDENFGPDPERDRDLLEKARETEDPRTWVWTRADKLFLKLIQEVHQRGMRIIIDGVFNHSGRGFFAFADLLKKGRASIYRDWYQITNWDSDSPDGFEYKGWWDHRSLPEFRRDDMNIDPGYKRYLFDITKRWMLPDGKLGNGIDGWRLDVAFCLPAGFWREWRSFVKGLNREAFLTGEVMEVAPSYLNGEQFDSLMNYPFAYSMVEYFCDKKNKISASEFLYRLEVLRNSYPNDVNLVMQNLVSSHDTCRLRTFITNPDLGYRNFKEYYHKSKLENNPELDVTRGGSRANNIHKLMVFFQMTYLGAPMIYYGDEVGMSGGCDPDCRKPMVWDDLTYSPEKMHPIQGKEKLMENNEVEESLLLFYKKMIRMRKQYPALSLGDFSVVSVDDQKDIFVFCRSYADQNIFVFVNNSDEEKNIVFKDKNIFIKAKSGAIYEGSAL